MRGWDVVVHQQVVAFGGKRSVQISIVLPEMQVGRFGSRKQLLLSQTNPRLDDSRARNAFGWKSRALLSAVAWVYYHLLSSILIFAIAFHGSSRKISPGQKQEAESVFTTLNRENSRLTGNDNLFEDPKSLVRS